MVSRESIEKQLAGLGFKHHGWGRAEVRELQNIILPEEEIFECVNGIYEGGFALLLATDVRVLLVDKKPLNYLTVEDLRFDMINEIDYSHRLIGAHIRISAGETILKFNSLNQPRLRALIGHVQRCMVEAKRKQATHPHLEQINQQLQSYMLAQYQQQQRLQEQLQRVQTGQLQPGAINLNLEKVEETLPEDEALPVTVTAEQLAELYEDGLQEVFGNQETPPPARGQGHHHSWEINPIKVAYSKLPAILHSRKLGIGLPVHKPHLPDLPIRGGQESASLSAEPQA